MAEPLRCFGLAAGLVLAALGVAPAQGQPRWQALPQGGPVGPGQGSPPWQPLGRANGITPAAASAEFKPGAPLWNPLPTTAGLARPLIWQPVSASTADADGSSGGSVGSGGHGPGAPDVNGKPPSAKTIPVRAGSPGQAQPMATPPTSLAEAQALLDGLKPTAADFSPQLRLGEAVPTAQQLSDQQSQFNFSSWLPLVVPSRGAAVAPATKTTAPAWMRA